MIVFFVGQVLFNDPAYTVKRACAYCVVVLLVFVRVYFGFVFDQPISEVRGIDNSSYGFQPHPERLVKEQTLFIMGQNAPMTLFVSGHIGCH